MHIKKRKKIKTIDSTRCKTSKPKGECSPHSWPSFYSGSSSTSESCCITVEAKPSSDMPDMNASVGEHCARTCRPGAYDGNVQQHNDDKEQASFKHKMDIHIDEGYASAYSAKRFKKCRSGISGSCPPVWTIDLYCEACHG